MRDQLAGRLLADVMGWKEDEKNRELPVLQTLAALKYDEYQKFSPGMRFVESLAYWLGQFDTPEERKTAYDFIRSRLIFLSEAEMAHFAAVMYPDILRSRLLELAAKEENVNSFRVGSIFQGKAFERLLKSTLFFGLSDGARIDQFRRSDRDLNHEQIFPSYQISTERIKELKGWREKQGIDKTPAPMVVLLDDFTASGKSYFRKEGWKQKGKIIQFMECIRDNTEWNGIVKFPETLVIVALYVATEQALNQINARAKKLKAEQNVNLEVKPVQILKEHCRIMPSSRIRFNELIENDKYYDPSVEDEDTKKGSDNLKYGFAKCGLPLVLHHNTPNNSLYLIWAEESEKGVRPLFQRFSRHWNKT